MYLKKLRIDSLKGNVRTINFRRGINLIVDETLDREETSTGNGVGKTTVLKLIDFCFGKDGEVVFKDPETKNIYREVKKYLVDEEIKISLELTTELDNRLGKDILLERNFLSYKKKIQRINGQEYPDNKQYLNKLLALIYPNQLSVLPTFRQIVSHNIRYSDEAVNHTMKTLNAYTTNAVYEMLFLFLLNCPFPNGSTKVRVLDELKREKAFKVRMSDNYSVNAYEEKLAQTYLEIQNLEIRRSIVNANPNFETDLIRLADVKVQVGEISSRLSSLRVRWNLIKEAEKEILNKHSDIDLQALRIIYAEATAMVQGIQKSFEELLIYHNDMLQQKLRFIVGELPTLESGISELKNTLQKLVSEEELLSSKISKMKEFVYREELVVNLNKLYEEKGRIEEVIDTVQQSETRIKGLETQVANLELDLYSKVFQDKVKSQISKFNRYFADISLNLYGQAYRLSYEIKEDKQGQKSYDFAIHNSKSFSSGEKLGETSCFDIAYVLFAESENLPTLKFLLSDKKELMHGIQLEKIVAFVNAHDMQFVVSILRDKLPPAMDEELYVILKLSQDDKLFRIESKET